MALKSILRMRWPWLSATNTLLLPSTARPVEHSESAVRAARAPALMARVQGRGQTRDESAPKGPANFAAVPVPSSNPSSGPFPTQVLQQRAQHKSERSPQPNKNRRAGGPPWVIRVRRHEARPDSGRACTCVRMAVPHDAPRVTPRRACGRLQRPGAGLGQHSQHRGRTEERRVHHSFRRVSRIQTRRRVKGGGKRSVWFFLGLGKPGPNVG